MKKKNNKTDNYKLYYLLGLLGMCALLKSQYKNNPVLQNTEVIKTYITWDTLSEIEQEQRFLKDIKNIMIKEKDFRQSTYGQLQKLSQENLDKNEYIDLMNMAYEKTLYEEDILKIRAVREYARNTFSNNQLKNMSFEEILQENKSHLRKECIESIVNFKQYNKVEGNVRISILKDLFGEEIIYDILTKNESDVYEEIIKKLNLSDLEAYKFWNLLDQLNNPKSPISKSDMTNSTILNIFRNGLKTSSFKKNIWETYVDHLEKEYAPENYILPNWSFLANENTGYPVLYTNSYVTLEKLTTKPNEEIEQNLERKGYESLYKAFKQINWQKQEYVESNEKIAKEAFILYSFLDKEKVIKKENETEEEYLNRMNLLFLNKNFYKFYLGLKSDPLKNWMMIANDYLQKIAQKGVSVEDIYNINLFFDIILNTNANSSLTEKKYQEFYQELKKDFTNLLYSQKQEKLVAILDAYEMEYTFYNPIEGSEKKNDFFSFPCNEENDTAITLPKEITPFFYVLEKHEFVPIDYTRVIEIEYIQDKIKYKLENTSKDYLIARIYLEDYLKDESLTLKREPKP